MRHTTPPRTNDRYSSHCVLRIPLLTGIVEKRPDDQDVAGFHV
jgi:hypothetical protein